jgi:hypothetical protein
MMTACAPRPAGSRPAAAIRPSDSLAVEVAAARHLLEPYADLAIEIQPAFGDSIAAPGSPGPTLRDAARTAAIARTLAARVAERPRGQRVADQTAEVLLSAPQFRGDTATITGTIGWYRDATPRSGSGYETVALTLLRDGARWRVIRVNELGRT